MSATICDGLISSGAKRPWVPRRCLQIGARPGGVLYLRAYDCRPQLGTGSQNPPLRKERAITNATPPKNRREVGNPFFSRVWTSSKDRKQQTTNEMAAGASRNNLAEFRVRVSRCHTRKDSVITRAVLTIAAQEEREVLPHSGRLVHPTSYGYFRETTYF